MILSDKYFYGKILLFGEYSIILGSKALSVPYRNVRGKLQLGINNEFSKSSNQSIANLLDFIIKSGLNTYFLIDEFKSALDDGLYFESNIPQGYGVGSSGALVASIFHEFSDKNQSLTNNELKALLGNIESYFHGKSSGLDPFMCYINQPVLIGADKSINVLDNFDIFKNSNFEFELIDSQTIGKTELLVNSFLDKCKNKHFKSLMENELIYINNLAIDTFLKGDFLNFRKYLIEISKFELTHFTEMIPQSIFDFWKNGIDSEKYYVKLCGSGGGGYFLKFIFKM